MTLLNLGCPIVPVKDKKPLVSWSRWMDGGQSEEERTAFLSSGGDVAIICGCYVEGRGYFFSLDFDIPFPQVFEKAAGLEGFTTYFEKTPRGGLHAYFFSQRPVPSFRFDDVPVELKGRGSLIIVHPSRGYEPLNDNPPREVPDGLALFIKVCKALGYDVEEKLAEKSGETVTDDGLLNRWLHEIVAELESRGLKPRRGPNYFTALCPFHPEHNPSFAINHRKFYAVDYHDGGIYNLLELGKALGLRLVTGIGEEEGRRIRVEFLIGGEVIDGSLIEVVSSAEGPRLLLYREKMVNVLREFKHGGITFRPYPHLPFPLPRIPENIGPDPPLWSETRDFIAEYFDTLDPRVYEVMTAAVAWSYFIHDVKGSTPYLLFLGPWRSGKTRALEVLEALCYRALRVVDPSEAGFFRSVHLFKPTLFVDEAQVVDANVRAVMASGYRYGSRVMRVVDPEADGFDGVKFFNTFAFIIYASREEPPPDILSRSIVIACERNTRPTAKRLDENRAAELRTRWLAQRLFYHGKIDVSFEEFESDDGRVQEIFSPLKVMAETFGDAKALESIMDFGRERERDIRQLEMATPEAEVVEALLKVVRNMGKDAPEVVYISQLQGELSGEWNPSKIGKRLSSLGFKRFRGSDGRRGYKLDYRLLSRLAVRYGLHGPSLEFQIT